MKDKNNMQSFEEFIIKRFNESEDISDVSGGSKNQIVLRNRLGEVVFDYCKLINSGDLDTAKEYLKVWINGDNSKKKNVIITLEFFKRSKEFIKTTKKLLDEI
jgi:hypothetical protein